VIAQKKPWLPVNYMNQKNPVGFLRRSKRIILYVAVTVVLTLAFVLATQWWLDPKGVARFPSFGTLKTVNVKAYWDESHVNETREISWGTVYPGSTCNTTFYLQSISNIETKLELITGNWTFRNSHGTPVLGPVNATSYMNLTWNYDNTNVDPRETLPVKLTLVASDSQEFTLFLINDDVREFSVDITIRAVESA